MKIRLVEGTKKLGNFKVGSTGVRIEIVTSRGKKGRRQSMTLIPINGMKEFALDVHGSHRMCLRAGAANLFYFTMEK